MIKLPIAALIAAVTLLGGFYGGYKTGQGNGSASNTALAQGTDRATRTGTGGIAAPCPSPGASPSPSASPNARGVRRGTTGTVTALTNTSFTVHDSRCNTDTKVTFDQSVIIRKTVNGQATDLQENQSVAVVGQRQTDGSVKANTITIVPANGGFGGVPAGNGG